MGRNSEADHYGLVVLIMTLRVSLVVDGDASGAKKAAADATTAIANMAHASGSAQSAIEAQEKRLTELFASATAGAREQSMTVGKELAETRGNEAAMNGFAHAHEGLSTQGTAAFHAMRSMAESLALGATPAQALTMQLNHLSYAATGPGGIEAAFKEVFAFVPGGMATIAIATGAATAAAAIYYSTVRANEPSLDRALENQKQLIDRIKEAYSGASNSAGHFFRGTKDELLLQAKVNRATLSPKFNESARDIASAFDASKWRHKMADLLTPFQSANEAFKRSIAAGRPDVDGLGKSIADIGLAAQKTSPEIAREATTLLDQIAPLRDMSVAMKQDEAVVRLLGGTATETDRKLIGLAGGGASALKSLIDERRDHISELKFRGRARR